jgi:hypothetical protein
MNKPVYLLITSFLISATMLAACTTTPFSSTNSVSSPIAPLATSNPNASPNGSVPPQTGNCTRLTKDDVGKVLGQTVTDVREEAKGTLCVYQTKAVIFELTFPNTGVISGVKFMENIRAINNSTLIPGLGDEAFYNTSSSYRILYVRKGNSVYTFGIRSEPPSQLPSPENIKSMEKTFAELLLTRLS